MADFVDGSSEMELPLEVGLGHSGSMSLLRVNSAQVSTRLSGIAILDDWDGPDKAVGRQRYGTIVLKQAVAVRLPDPV